ncbi:MAG: hypothetical protein KDD64_06555, partial [Bdellovibrionales bacterium]|nr:hypothetical protein [Bdellovibrionales bacterium]
MKIFNFRKQDSDSHSASRGSFVANLLFLFGLLLGFLVPAAPQILIHFRYERSFGLEEALDSQDRESVMRAYDSSVDFRNVSFNPPNLPTPFVGTAPRPGRDRNATINIQQFRYPEDLEKTKPANEFRIFLTGGSTAYGAGASSMEKTIAGFLEQLFLEWKTEKRVRVITAANTGWSSTHERNWIINHIMRFQPDVVLSLTGFNDVHYGAIGLEPVLVTSPHENYFRNIALLVQKTIFFSDLPRTNVPENTPISCDTVISQFIQNLRVAGFALQQQKIPYFVFLQPSLFTSSKALSHRETNVRDRERDPYFSNCYSALETILEHEQ